MDLHTQPSIFHRFWWIIVIFVVGLGGTFIYMQFFYNRGQSNTNQPLIDETNTQNIPQNQKSHGEQKTDTSAENCDQYYDLYSCSTAYTAHGTPTFTHLPVDITEIQQIVPMGAAGSGAKVDAKTGAGAHNIPSDHSSPAFVTRIPGHKTYAVADGTLVDVSYAAGRWVAPTAGAAKLDDMSITFQFSKNFFLLITHLTQLDPALAAKLGTLKEGENYVTVPITAGEVLGYTGGSSALGTFDFWAIDLDSKPAFIVPTHYSTRDPHSVDPYQFFVEPLRSEMYAKLPKRAAPAVGQYDYDIDGTISGNWFVDTGSQKITSSPVLSFFTDNFDPSIVLIGDSDTGTVDTVAGNKPLPADVTPSTGLVKYVLHDKNNNGTQLFTDGVALVQMTGSRRLEFEIFPNKTAGEVTAFDDQAKYYIR